VQDRMKVTEVKLFIVNKPGSVAWGQGNKNNYIIVKVLTDEGLYGVGEAFHSLEEPVEGCIAKYRRWLIGQDPTRVIRNWEALYRGLRYPAGTAELSALAAVEQALWDISGKACGLPVYKMLGGPCRDKIRVYASRWPDACEGLPLDEQAKVVVEHGWTAFKYSPQVWDYEAEPQPSLGIRSPEKSSWQSLQEEIERVQIVREAVGDDIDICLDYHGRSFSAADAIRLARAIEPFHPFFLEEPALTENPDALVDVKRQTSIPIAGGERVIHRDVFKQVIEKRAVDIIQLEPTACGGILETVKRAAMAELYHIMLAPHQACGTIALAACAHIDAVVPNFLIQECNVDPQADFERELFCGGPTIENGWMALPEGPGLGVDFNEDVALAYPAKPWDRPVIINPDGSIGLE
jgi:galactonate dehydratase